MGSKNRVDILLYDYIIDAKTSYSLKISGVTVPNVNSDSFSFEIISYYSDNIPKDQKICEMEFNYPAFTAVDVQKCHLYIDSQYNTIQIESLYTF